MRAGQAVRDASGFRRRGQQVTRIETFVDAAFAFSLTLLVIFHNDLPQTVAELRAALLRVPAFVLCFAILALFWAAHNRWSRRFGLDDARSIVLSLAFVLVVLVYVYPLRMVVSSFMSVLTGGLLPGELGIDPARRQLDVQTAFVVYSLGFGLLSAILWLLNRHALGQADALGLDEGERYQLHSEIGSHAILCGCALLSLLASALVLALHARGWVATGLPMWLYAGLAVLMPLYWARRRRACPSPAEHPA